MHRWDEYTRTLKACKLSVVAGGRCFQCTPIEADGTTDELPLLMPLHRIDFVAPSVAAGAFAAGTTPGHSWLYFTVGWSRQEESQPSGGAPESRVSAVGVHGGYRPAALSGSSAVGASSSVVVRQRLAAWEMGRVTFGKAFVCAWQHWPRHSRNLPLMCLGAVTECHR